MGLTSSRMDVEAAAKSDKVVVFSTTTCPYCTKAKDMFRSRAVPYKTVEMDSMPNSRSVMNDLSRMTRSYTVPQIFVCGQFIGGFVDALRLNESGALQKMVDECDLSTLG